jgi:hypothetical protein
MDSKVKKDDSKKLANLIKVEPTKEVVNIEPKRIKTGGRVKGTPNVLTSELRETLKEFLSNEISNLSKQDVLSKLTLSERLVFITKILPYVLPKVEPIEGTYDEPGW